VELKPNPLREKLAAGKTVTGACLFSWSPIVADVAGSAGLEWVRIDNEHAWQQDDSAIEMIQAAERAGVVPILRIDRENPYLIRKALELGAGGILIPDVNTAAQAGEIVDAAKFPPLGKRGFSTFCWSARWGGVDGREWAEWSNREPMIGVMIENVAVLPELDAIMATEGIDFAYFGPADYSMSLGLGAPDKNHKDVQGALDNLIEAAEKHGKYVAYNPGADGEELKKAEARGIKMLEAGNDCVILRNAWKKSVESI
jgi:4-hydroxy-2-oxoheptanedioate aldolase